MRPENLEDAALATGGTGGLLRGRVELREALGAEVLVHFAIAARAAATEDTRELAEDVGDDRVVDQLRDERRSATLVGRFSPRTRANAGETVDVWVDLDALHFFDPDSGLAIRG
jgi:multiple sugar transport system ATP-binding protein